MNKLLFVVLSVISFSVYAEQYRILFVSADDIKCGGSVVTAMDTISDKDNISWGSSDAPYMIVKNLSTKQQKKLSSQAMNLEGVSSIGSFKSWIESFSNYYVKTNKTSTQSVPVYLLKIDLPVDTFYLDDIITIETNLPIDGFSRYFSITSNFPQSKKCKLSIDSDSLLVISKTALLENGLIKKNSKRVKLNLVYNNPSLKKSLRKELTFLIIE